MSAPSTSAPLSVDSPQASTGYRSIEVTTQRGLTAAVRIYGDGDAGGDKYSPIVFFHGFMGLFESEPLLEMLGREYAVYAPVLPGYGPESPESGETVLDDMLDLTLHGWDLVQAITGGSETRPGDFGNVHLMGHDMGAMITAEMASVSPTSVDRLTLISPLGMWDPAAPIRDIFSQLPFEFPSLLFADTAVGTTLLAGGLDFENPAAIEAFQVRNSRRLGFAGKLLFPIPNRRLSKRAYRIGAPTTVIWGESDALTPPLPYASIWDTAIPRCTTTIVPDAGHCVHLEQPTRCAEIVASGPVSQRLR